MALKKKKKSKCGKIFLFCSFILFFSALIIALFFCLPCLHLFLSCSPLILLVLAGRSHDGSSRESRVWLAEQQVKGMWDTVCVCVCVVLERTAGHMWECVCLSNIVNTSWLEAALLFAYFFWFLKEKSSSWCLWGDDRRQRTTKLELRCCKAPWEQEGCSCERNHSRCESVRPSVGSPAAACVLRQQTRERETIWSHHTLLQRGP